MFDRDVLRQAAEILEEMADAAERDLTTIDFLHPPEGGGFLTSQ